MAPKMVWNLDCKRMNHCSVDEPSGWFGILEYASLKVSGSIPFNVNFGGQVHTVLCSGLELLWQVSGGIGHLRLIGPWIGYRV
ncbi:hypothetical protein MtrunA17_Chr4g0018271 [Medicago truncatula]|uniref:Uncharacterized protein n=1 Tax=Medicago truncatula TaxID=3880 RepID=A0A072UIZ4_MEDTR|nr:hypothetical protein MTR_4g035900 [Medicago truncatula]RHN59810.1 hypothetical protein MtrunA17_Chr4g0018271 [Medicago truncatula]